jgi:predicted DNA-binding transcriptional regulator AlpA
MTKQPNPNANSAYFDAAALCALFNISPCTLWRWAKIGNIPRPIKLNGGSKNLWRREEIEAAIEAAAAAREVAA